MPDSSDLRAFVARYASAVSARDVDNLLSMFATDAVQLDPANTPAHLGHDAIRRFLQDAIDASSSSDFEVLNAHTCGDSIAIDFRVTVGLGSSQDPSKMTIEGIEVFHLNDDLLVDRVEAYWDDSDVTIV